MSKEQMLFYLFASFIDKYSLKFMKNEDNGILNEFYKKARKVHYDMQEFIDFYDHFIKQNKSEYYDFFFENMVKNDISCEALIEKYIVFKDEVKDNA